MECPHFQRKEDIMSTFIIESFVFATERSIPKFFETNLKALVIEYKCLSGYLPQYLRMLFTHTTIWPIVFIIGDLMVSVQQVDIIHVLGRVLGEGWLVGSGVMELRFETKDEKEENISCAYRSCNKATDWDPKLCCNCDYEKMKQEFKSGSSK